MVDKRKVGNNRAYRHKVDNTAGNNACANIDER